MKLKPSQSSNFVFGAALGDGTVVGFVGYLMKFVNPDVLFYCMGAFNFATWYLTILAIKKMTTEKQNKDTT